MKTVDSQRKLKVIIADDHPIMLEAVRELLEDLPDIEVAATALNGDAAVNDVAKHHPDVVLLDIRMPGLSGTEAAREIKRQHPRTQIVCMSISHEDAIVQEALDCGASGYVLKGSSGSAFADAIRTVASGKPYFSPGIRAGATNSDKATP